MNILLSRTPKHILTMIVEHWIISFAHTLDERAIWKLLLPQMVLRENQVIFPCVSLEDIHNFFNILPVLNLSEFL